MEDTIRKRQHIVPKFYLKQFCNKDGQLYAFDLVGKKAFLASPDKICIKNYVYETEWRKANPKLGKFVQPNSIEISFSQKEAIYSQLLEKLIRYCQTIMPIVHLVCSTEEKHILADFTANLFLRDPDIFFGIIQTNYSIEDLNKLELYDQTKALFSLLDWGSPDSLITHAIKSRLFEKTIDGSPAQRMVERLLSMHPIFFLCSKSRFITSSRPVMLFEINRRDDERVGNVCFFPLSPAVLLMYTDMPQYRNYRNRVIEISPTIALQFNRNFLLPHTGSVQFLIAKESTDFEGIVL